MAMTNAGSGKGGPDTVRRSRRLTVSERVAYFLFVFVLSLGSVAFAALTGQFEFGWRAIAVGSLAGLALGCVVAFAGDTLRDLVFWLFFP
jgi:hypothetical protein